jgi:hypothetical protein
VVLVTKVVLNGTRCPHLLHLAHVDIAANLYVLHMRTCFSDKLHIAVTTACGAFHLCPGKGEAPLRMLQADITLHPMFRKSLNSLNPKFHTAVVGNRQPILTEWEMLSWNESLNTAKTRFLTRPPDGEEDVVVPHLAPLGADDEQGDSAGEYLLQLHFAYYLLGFL